MFENLDLTPVFNATRIQNFFLGRGITQCVTIEMLSKQLFTVINILREGYGAPLICPLLSDVSLNCCFTDLAAKVEAAQPAEAVELWPTDQQPNEDGVLAFSETQNL